jgi:hypothetical protein
MTATHRSPPQESKIINLTLFLVTLSRTAKLQETFRLSSLCHIAVKEEAYRAQNALTQYHNCQDFGSPLLVVRRGSPAQRVQLSVARRRNTQSRKLSGLQTRERRDADREVAENTQDYNGEGVLFQPHHSRRVLRGGAPRQDTGKAAASDT